jgi:sugar lactone lactonase YvrE
MKRFRTKAVAALVVSAVVVIGAAAASPASAASTEAGQPCPVITDVRTVAAFDSAAGQEAESVSITRDGSLIVSMLGFLVGKPPELVRVSPSGQQTILVTGPVGDAIGGNAIGRDGTIYYNVVSPDPSRSGVWHLPPYGAARRITAMPAGEFLNGLTLDSNNRTLYVADSVASTIWAIPASGGPAKAWLVGPALAPSPSGNGIGANGIEYHNGAVWFSNTDQGTLLRVPVTASGAPGPIHLIAGNLAGIDDFKLLSDRSDVAFVALNFQDKLAVVYPDGRTRIVLDASSGLDSPTNTAISGTQIYITNSGLAAPNNASLQAGRINIGALFDGTAW